MTGMVDGRTVVIARLLGIEDSERPVFADQGCPACRLCWDLSLHRGVTLFIEIENEIYRTECVIDGVGFACAKVTREQAEKEMAER